MRSGLDPALRRRYAGCCLLTALLPATAACYNYTPQLLPDAPSPAPVRPPGPTSGLRAAFGRADITPPPGVGLFGFGPESERARGHRTRLYARSLVLEDRRGERIAFVALDLGAASPLLHRRVAERVVGATGIGADRLILSATHTHTGPNHFYGAKLYNDRGSSVAGFDTVMVKFLAERVAASITEAVLQLSPARAAWGREAFWGHTRNRSYDAFTLNDPQATLPTPPPDVSLSREERSVDPTWTMLRVDLFDRDRGRYEPAGALSIFAVHGTANPAVTDLFDGDLHALLERGLEHHIDRTNGQPQEFRPRAIHLVVNGTSGDVSPAWPKASRCPPRQLAPAFRPAGPRGPPPAESWQEPSPETRAACLGAARDYVEQAGAALSARAIALFDRLHAPLSDDLLVGRAFRTIAVRGPAAPPGLCPKPKMGMAALAGADDGYTRYHRWRFLGLIDIGYEEGGSAIDRGARDCHAPKRTALWPFHDMIAGPHGFPEAAQFEVVRIGGMVLGFVPIEVTTTVGARMKAAMQTAVPANRLPQDSIALVTLSNGYLQYVTTREEHAAQSYEGASNIYGPGGADVYGGLLAMLTQRLYADSDPVLAGSSYPALDSLVVYPGKPKSIFPSSTAGPPAQRIQRRFEEPRCRGDTLMVGWIDAYPGRLIPADGPIVRIERRSAEGTWQPVVWDDDPNLEVRALRPRGDQGYLWAARWTPKSAAGGPIRAVLVERPGFAETTGRPFEGCRSRSN